MTPNQAREFIYAAFKTAWDASAYSAVPYVFPNEGFDSNRKAEWINVAVFHSTDGGQYTLGPVGSRTFRRRGLVSIEVYVAVDGGLLRLDELQKAARDIFEGKTINGVSFVDGDFQEGGPFAFWWRGPGSIAFDYDEVK